MSSKSFYPARHTRLSLTQPLTLLRALHRTLTDITDSVSRMIGAMVGAMAGAVAVGMIVGAIVAPIAAPALLALVGFGSAGPIAGEFVLLCV